MQATCYGNYAAYRGLRILPYVRQRKGSWGRQNPYCRPSFERWYYKPVSRMGTVFRPGDRMSPSLHQTTTSLDQCDERSLETTGSNSPGRTYEHCNAHDHGLSCCLTLVPATVFLRSLPATGGYFTPRHIASYIAHSKKFQQLIPCFRD